jgi:RNA polymerase sigma factor (sigma-70 family)
VYGTGTFMSVNQLVPSTRPPSPEAPGCPRSSNRDMSGGTTLADPPADHAEFVEFAKESAPRLLSLVNRLGLGGADAEDLAAEALARAFAHWSRVSQYEFRDAWVMRVATNLAYDRFRRHKWRDRFNRLEVQPRATPSFESSVTDRLLVTTVINSLPRRQREAVTLHFIADLTIAETAYAMRVAEGTVRTHLDRASRELRTRLIDKEDLQ